MPTLKCTAGDARTRTTAQTNPITIHGAAITRAAMARHIRPVVNLLGTTGSRLMRGPRIPRMAGSSVSATSSETSVTMLPPMPSERNIDTPESANPRKPTLTTTAETRMARPEVATVVATACSTGRPLVTSSRKRFTMKSE